MAKGVKRSFRLLPFLPAALIIAFVLAGTIPGQHLRNWRVAVAHAQASGYPAQPYRNYLGNLCSGSGTLASGTLQLNADCLAGYTLINCAPQGQATPGNFSIQCNATVTSTGSPSPAATHTVIIINASTANATPVVNWWGTN